ncbi:hypothetical protein F4809DRAFT_661000 [Biscogniauxia mediterranea]|nr:hypothetical protein F4809DRAFT_661000 [Biscogniauxia mediterranea]
MAGLPEETWPNSLWFAVDSVEQPAVCCCECGLVIQAEETLARTFTLQQPDSTPNLRVPTAHIAVPTLSQVIWIYSRHEECLYQAARYVAISHVWHPAALELAATNVHHDAPAIILEITTRIALGLAGHVPADTEIWHDYISVPQWQPALKEKTIQAIPRIFGRAEFTVAYLSDIDQETVCSMRRGVWLSDRVRGISTLCSSRWFSRVWTAVELVVSRKIRAMLRDFTLLEDSKPQTDFVEDIFAAWSAEARRIEDTRYLEGIAGIGENLVPWQLGPLELVRDMRRGGQQAPFGVAHELLARRCVTVPRDYLRAFVTVSISDLTEPELSADMREALLQIARSCIEKNDYSPLFMVPKPTQEQNAPGSNARLEGYMDFRSFGIGHVTKPAPAGNIAIAADGLVPVVRMENLGQIKAAEEVVVLERRRPDEHAHALSQAVDFVLRFAGADADAFVDALAVRLYAQSRRGIRAHLAAGGGARMAELREALEALRRSADPEMRRRLADAVAALLCLSTPTPAIGSPLVRGGVAPLDFMETHGRRIHLGDGAAALVAAECRRCGRGFPLRVGMVRPLAEALGSTAYRVPGLQYRFSHEGGMGVLLKGRTIVARFVWGTPTCECPKLEEVPVQLELPLPQPNEFRYGPGQHESRSVNPIVGR